MKTKKWQPLTVVVRPHEMQRQFVAVGNNLSFFLVDTVEIDLGARLYIDEHFARFGDGQRLDGTAAGIEYFEIFPRADTQMFVMQIIHRFVFHTIERLS